jgi:hypothetical protein
MKSHHLPLPELGDLYYNAYVVLGKALRVLPETKNSRASQRPVSST